MKINLSKFSGALFITRGVKFLRSKLQSFFNNSSVSANFIPYACHYLPDTVVSQSGDLTQIIRIDFREIKGDLPKDLVLREKIRGAIQSVVQSGNMDVAFSLHTVRHGTAISDLYKFESEFSALINKRWNDKVKLRKEYSNVLYIGVTISGLREGVSLKHLFQYIAMPIIKKQYLDHLDISHKRLDAITNSIMSGIGEFLPTKLSVVKNNGEYYSEFICTLVKNIGLSNVDEKLKSKDLSFYFLSTEVKFGHNTFEILGKDGSKFGCIMGLKDVVDVPIEVLDSLLSKNFGLLINETIESSRDTRRRGKRTKIVRRLVKKRAKEVEHQRYITNLGRDKQLIDDMADFERNETLFACKSVSVMLIENTLAELESTASAVDSLFTGAGYMMYRHDIGLEQAYWAQLPGNFPMVQHRRLMAPSNIANFLHVHSGSEYDDDYWGMPLTYMVDQQDTQHSISFHHDHSDHCMILGQRDDCRVMAHFFLTQVQKFNATILYLDPTGSESNKIFIKLLGGKHIDSSRDHENTGILRDFLGNLAHNNLTANLPDIVDLLWSDGKRLQEMADGVVFGEKRRVYPAVLEKILYVDLSSQRDSSFVKNLLCALKITKQLSKNPMLVLFNKPWLASINVDKILHALKDMDKMGCSAMFLHDEMGVAACSDHANFVGDSIHAKFYFPTSQAREWYTGADSYITDWLRVVARKGSESLVMKKSSQVIALKFEYRDIPLFSLLNPGVGTSDFLRRCFVEQGEDVNSWIDRLEVQ